MGSLNEIDARSFESKIGEGNLKKMEMIYAGSLHYVGLCGVCSCCWPDVCSNWMKHQKAYYVKCSFADEEFSANSFKYFHKTPNKLKFQLHCFHNVNMSSRFLIWTIQGREVEAKGEKEMYCKNILFVYYSLKFLLFFRKDDFSAQTSSHRLTKGWTINRIRRIFYTNIVEERRVKFITSLICRWSIIDDDHFTYSVRRAPLSIIKRSKYLTLRFQREFSSRKDSHQPKLKLITKWKRKKDILPPSASLCLIVCVCQAIT